MYVLCSKPMYYATKHMSDCELHLTITLIVIFLQVSAFWHYFKVNDTDESKATCSICNEVFLRGGSDNKICTSSPLVTQLERKLNTEHINTLS